jgi:hypothetical protein
MALTPSGAISMSDINTALNRGSTASISFNDTQVRFLANQDTGSVVINSMRNKQSTVGTITVGFYDDGKTQVAGCQVGVFGSLSSNSFFGGTISQFVSDLNGDTNIIIGTVAVGTAINARMKVSSPTPLTRAMTKSGNTGYYTGYGGDFFFGYPYTGQTFTFQFAQT